MLVLVLVIGISVLSLEFPDCFDLDIYCVGENEAFDTVSEAIRAVKLPGDKIVVRGGEYREHIKISKSIDGTFENPVEIFPFGRENVTFEVTYDCSVLLEVKQSYWKIHSGIGNLLFKGPGCCDPLKEGKFELIRLYQPGIYGPFTVVAENRCSFKSLISLLEVEGSPNQQPFDGVQFTGIEFIPDYTSWDVSTNANFTVLHSLDIYTYRDNITSASTLDLSGRGTRLTVEKCHFRVPARVHVNNDRFSYTTISKNYFSESSEYNLNDYGLVSFLDFTDVHHSIVENNIFDHDFLHYIDSRRQLLSIRVENHPLSSFNYVVQNNLFLCQKEYQNEILHIYNDTVGSGERDAAVVSNFAMQNNIIRGKCSTGEPKEIIVDESTCLSCEFRWNVFSSQSTYLSLQNVPEHWMVHNNSFFGDMQYFYDEYLLEYRNLTEVNLFDSSLSVTRVFPFDVFGRRIRKPLPFFRPLLMDSAYPQGMFYDEISPSIDFDCNPTVLQVFSAGPFQPSFIEMVITDTIFNNETNTTDIFYTCKNDFGNTTNWDPKYNCSKCRNYYKNECNDCGTCPGNLDIDSDCTQCKNKWKNDDNNCYTCPANWDSHKDCNSCDKHWQGLDCTICPENYDPDRDCSECIGNFEGWNCKECKGNYDAGLDCEICKYRWINRNDYCSTCPGNIDPGQKCNICRNKWENIDDNCKLCPGNWDGSRHGDCKICKGNWDIENNCDACRNNWVNQFINGSWNECGTCQGNWDGSPTGDCKICKFYWVDEGNDCGTCPGNFNAQKDCNSCIEGWKLDVPNQIYCDECKGNWNVSTNCLTCKWNWVNNDNDCGTCPGNWDANRDCGQCLGHFDESTGCTKCKNRWVDTEFGNCTLCPDNFDPDNGDCSHCRQFYALIYSSKDTVVCVPWMDKFYPLILLAALFCFVISGLCVSFIVFVVIYVNSPKWRKKILKKRFEKLHFRKQIEIELWGESKIQIPKWFLRLKGEEVSDDEESSQEEHAVKEVVIEAPSIGEHMGEEMGEEVLLDDEDEGNTTPLIPEHPEEEEESRVRRERIRERKKRRQAKAKAKREKKLKEAEKKKKMKEKESKRGKEIELVDVPLETQLKIIQEMVENPKKEPDAPMLHEDENEGEENEQSESESEYEYVTDYEDEEPAQLEIMDSKAKEVVEKEIQDEEKRKVEGGNEIERKSKIAFESIPQADENDDEDEEESFEEVTEDDESSEEKF